MGTKADFTERDLRYRKLRQAMAAEGMQAVILAGHASHFNRGHIRYYADAHMWAGDAMLLLPLESDPMLAWVCYAGSGWPEKLWITDIRRGILPQKRLVEAMEEKHLTGGKVGIAGLGKVMRVDAYEMLRERLPGVEFVNADLMVNRLRAVKSPLEIQRSRECWQMSAAAMNRFIEVAGPDVTEREAAAEATQVYRAAGCFDDLTVIHEGEFRGLPRDVRMQGKDKASLHLELCNESGHWSEIDATVCFKQPTDLELKIMDDEFRAYEALRKAAKPGVLLSELAYTFNQFMVDSGWKLGEPSWHFYFHGHGMDDIEWPYFNMMMEDNADVALEEGMVFNYHPHHPTVPDVTWATKITDDIVITANGAERLSGDWDFRWRIRK